MIMHPGKYSQNKDKTQIQDTNAYLKALWSAEKALICGHEQ